MYVCDIDVECAGAAALTVDGQRLSVDVIGIFDAVTADGALARSDVHRLSVGEDEVDIAVAGELDGAGIVKVLAVADVPTGYEFSLRAVEHPDLCALCGVLVRFNCGRVYVAYIRQVGLTDGRSGDVACRHIEHIVAVALSDVGAVSIGILHTHGVEYLALRFRTRIVQRYRGDHGGIELAAVFHAHSISILCATEGHAIT